MVCWGTKYPVSLINHLASSIAEQAKDVPRFVLITDREHPGLRPDIQTRAFPDFYLQEPFRRSGCQAKLAMFEPGVLPDDLPTVYIDLDTIVLGDLGRAIGFMKNRQTVLMLHSAIIPFGRIGRAVWRFTRHRKYARGNSSLVVFHPAECSYVAERFKALNAQHPNFGFRPLIADERFISWSAQPHMERLPSDFAVKFPGEYMFPWTGWLYLKALLPWVRRRRRRQVAVTLNGLMIKPEVLVKLRDNDVIEDQKSRKLVWSHRTLGPVKDKILQFYANVV